MTYPNIRTERSFEAYSRGAELIRAIHALSERTNEPVEALKSEFDLTADEWAHWSGMARGAVLTTAEPAEKTYTLTLTENEMARVIHALTVDAESLRALDAADPQSLASALAEASEALRTRCCEVVSPWRDPVSHVPTDERWREEAQHNL